MKVRQDWRIEFACGGRAERIATSDFHLLRRIGDRLSCAPEEAPAAIEKASAERDASFKSLRAALQQLAEARAKLLIETAATANGGVRLISSLLQEESVELLLPLATELAKNDKTIAVLVHEPTGQLVFAQSPGGARDLSAVLKQVLAAFPGKGGGTRDFVRAKLIDPTHSNSALALARELTSR